MAELFLYLKKKGVPLINFPESRPHHTPTP